MRGISAVLAVVSVVVLGGCASEPRIIHSGSAGRVGPSASGYGRSEDGLSRTERDARSVEGIVSSVARIGRVLAGAY